MQAALLRGYLGDYLRQKQLPLGRSFCCLNPSHEDKHPSMSYNKKAGNVHCFSCGATYDIFDLVGIDYDISSFYEQVNKVCEIFNEAPPDLRYLSYGSLRREFPSKREDKASGLAEIQSCATGNTDYLLCRGISPESCREYGLFQTADRAYFPIYEQGLCVGWCGRAMDDSLAPRYKNSSGSMGLWNGDYLTMSGEGGRLFLTEGIVDAICLEQMGQRAVALCGSQNTAKLLRRLEASLSTANTWRFVSCGDPDDAGRKMNQALEEGLGRLGLSISTLDMPSGCCDIADLYLNDTERLAALLSEPEEDASDYVLTSSVAAGLDAFFAEAMRKAGADAVPTGFSGLDRLLDGGLYPGLYVVGAISSLGKTSFVLQIADVIAGQTEDVLYFSLEQSRFELIAKSLSRTTAQLDVRQRRNAFTARQIMSGHDPGTRKALLEEAKQVYAKAAAGLYIREGLADIGTDEIRGAVMAHREKRGSSPVVIVDYLQILKPADPRFTDKQNTDRAVVDLKRLSRDFNTPVIAISSFNRENYKTSVSMEAFKESGAVEYSSDVLIGLQLEGAGSRDFDANKAKACEPRRVELVILKNRNGIPYAKLTFSYTAKFSLFEEIPQH